MELEIKQFIEDVFKSMAIPLRKVDITVNDDGEYYVNILSPESSLLIGYHGDNLIALQHVIKMAFLRQNNEDLSFTIDVDGYRKRQEEGVIALAERKVDMVRINQKPVSLPPMSPYFRRVVHLYLTKPEFADVTTSSDGQGEMRRVLIMPVVS